MQTTRFRWSERAARAAPASQRRVSIHLPGPGSDAAAQARRGLVRVPAGTAQSARWARWLAPRSHQHPSIHPRNAAQAGCSAACRRCSRARPRRSSSSRRRRPSRRPPLLPPPRAQRSCFPPTPWSRRGRCTTSGAPASSASALQHPSSTPPLPAPGPRPASALPRPRRPPRPSAAPLLAPQAVRCVPSGPDALQAARRGLRGAGGVHRRQQRGRHQVLLHAARGHEVPALGA
jgi:hypothetical protein